MAPNSDWCDLGPIERFTKRPLTATTVGTTRIVVTHRDGEFGALSGVCNHAGGPVAEGRLAARAIDHAQLLLDHETAPDTTERGGRKAHRLVLEELGTDEVAGEVAV